MAHNCDFCGQKIEDNLEKCPNCGAVNSHYQRAAITQPKTIEELKLWYKQMNLPPEETTRFFIGKDHRAAKCYGIYQDPDTKKFIVYKFKADGTRAVRYEGDDEAYAVNEIFQKLREVIAVQKGMNAVDSKYGRPTGKTTGRKRNSSFKAYLIVMLCVWFTGVFLTVSVAFGGCLGKKHPERDKYYKYGDEYYYNFRGKYYRYNDDDDDWYYYGYDAPFGDDDYEDYEVDYGSSSYGGGNFYDSEVYQDWYDSQQNDSYDNNDSGWDSGWDSGDSWDSDYGSDWDSDW